MRISRAVAVLTIGLLIAAVGCSRTVEGMAQPAAVARLGVDVRAAGEQRRTRGCDDVVAGREQIAVEVSRDAER